MKIFILNNELQFMTMIRLTYYIITHTYTHPSSTHTYICTQTHHRTHLHTHITSQAYTFYLNSRTKYICPTYRHPNPYTHGVTSRTGTAYPSRVLAFPPFCKRGSCCSIFSCQCSALQVITCFFSRNESGNQKP